MLNREFKSSGFGPAVGPHFFVHVALLWATMRALFMLGDSNISHWTFLIVHKNFLIDVSYVIFIFFISFFHSTSFRIQPWSEDMIIFWCHFLCTYFSRIVSMSIFWFFFFDIKMRGKRKFWRKRCCCPKRVNLTYIICNFTLRSWVCINFLQSI